MSDFDDIPLESGDAKVETFNRDLECEHTHNPDPPTGELEGCDRTAEFAVTTADYGEPTRVRYCRIHVWNGLVNWMERQDKS